MSNMDQERAVEIAREVAITVAREGSGNRYNTAFVAAYVAIDKITGFMFEMERKNNPD